MDGYKIVYRQPDGAISDTFFGEPIMNIRLSEPCYMEVIKLLFGSAHPGCEIVSIKHCRFDEFMN